MAVQLWCKEARLNKSFTASLSSYGEARAMALRRAWAQRMEFLFELSQAEGRAFVFSKEALGGFDEGPELATMYEDGSQAFRQRVDTIRSLVPRFIA